MKNIITILIVGLVIVVGGSAYYYLGGNNSNTATNSGNLTSYTMAEITKHNTANDCWMVINSNVYNVTSYVTKHPRAASTIILGCGTDATAEYTGERKHYGRDALLATFKIGILG